MATRHNNDTEPIQLPIEIAGVRSRPGDYTYYEFRKKLLYQQWISGAITTDQYHAKRQQLPKELGL